MMLGAIYGDNANRLGTLVRHVSPLQFKRIAP